MICIRYVQLIFLDLSNILRAPKFYSALQSDYLMCLTHMKEKKVLLRHILRGFYQRIYFCQNFSKTKYVIGTNDGIKTDFILGLFFWSMAFTFVGVEVQAFITPLFGRIYIAYCLFWLLVVSLVCSRPIL